MKIVVFVWTCLSTKFWVKLDQVREAMVVHEEGWGPEVMRLSRRGLIWLENWRLRWLSSEHCFNFSIVSSLLFHELEVVNSIVDWGACVRDMLARYISVRRNKLLRHTPRRNQLARHICMQSVRARGIHTREGHFCDSHACEAHVCEAYTCDEVVFFEHFLSGFFPLLCSISYLET